MRGHKSPVVEALRREVIGPERKAPSAAFIYISSAGAACKGKAKLQKQAHAQANRNFYCAVYYVPGEQQGGACAQWADEMNGQFPSLVVGDSEANLNVFQTADELWPSPAGIHALAEHQLVPYVSAGLTSGGDAG